MKKFALIFLAAILAAAAPSFANDVRHETVHFTAGTSGATLKGSIKGYESVRYTIGVNAGQKMSVQLDTSKTTAYFNISAPGASEALYNSSINGNGTSLTVPSSGNYVVDVYLMRNEARRNNQANYTMTLYVE